MISEPMGLSEVCGCHPSTSHNKHPSNIPRVAHQSSRHVTDRKHSLPSNMTRRQQTHGTRTMGSLAYDNMAIIENSVSHLGKYLPAPLHFLARILWS
jgi:hypothetical protein